MARARTTALSIALVVVLGAAIVHWATDGDALPPDAGLHEIGLPDVSAPEVSSAPLPAPIARATESARVWVEVKPVQRMRPVGEMFEVIRLGQSVRAEASVLAGAGGSFVPLVQRKGAVVVRVRVGTAEWHRRVARGDDGVLSVELGVERAVRGRVVDQKAQPIAGAVVWCGGRADETTTTDADGRFEAFVAAGAGVPVVVRAAGKAWKHAFVQVEPSNGADVAFVLLDEKAVLVQAAGTVESLRDAEVAVVPLGVLSTELQTYPFFAQGLWTDTVLDAEGRGVLHGLPQGCEVGVLLLGPGVCRAAPVEVALRGDGPVHARLSAPDRPRVAIEFVDERGAPIPDCEARCVPQERAATDAALGPFLLPEWLPPRGGSVRVRGGERQLTSHTEGKLVRVQASDGITVAETEPFVPGAKAVRVVVPQRPLGRPSIVVPPPKPGVAWLVRVDPATKGEFVEVGADTAFVAELDGAMVVDVLVRTPDGAAWSVPREARGLVVTAPTGLSPAIVTGR